MIRFLLAPRWLAWHGALVVVLVAFTLLGTWQLDSYEETGRQQDAAAAREPAPVTDVVAPGERLTTDDVGRTVTATGWYDAGNQLLVPGRRLDEREGFLVVTPLQTPEGFLPVNRGWVESASAVTVEPPDGDVSITGVVQPSESERDSEVDALAGLPEGQIPYLATVLLLDALPYTPDELYDGYVVLRGEQPTADAAPQAVEPRDLDGGVSKWRNLGYALQWWFFAAAAVFFWLSVIRRSLRERRAEEPAPV